MKQLLLAIAVILLGSAEVCAGSPPAEYIEAGACPFECCTYRAWNTKTDTAAYVQPDRTARVVGVLKAGTTVEAVTGEVHAKPVRFVVKRPHGGHNPGDIL
jgi:hypothetical protein